MQNFLCRYGNVSQVPESQDRLAGFRIFPDLKETAEVRINDLGLTCLDYQPTSSPFPLPEDWRFTLMKIFDDFL